LLRAFSLSFGFLLLLSIAESLSSIQVSLLYGGIEEKEKTLISIVRKDFFVPGKIMLQKCWEHFFDEGRECD
jgi:hypothetical protein